MSRCVVCIGSGHWHPEGVERLGNSLFDTAVIGTVPPKFMGWKEFPSGCPDHAHTPYGFKVWAMQQGLKYHDSVLWLDSSFWALKDISPIFDIIEKEGYFLWNSGWDCSTWTRDKALKYFNVTRDEAERIPMISAGCLGLSRNSAVAMSFMDQWEQSMRSGVFNGSHFRESGDKEDARYRGHRHDQSAASILAHQHGMSIHEGDDLVSYWKEGMKESTVLTLRGL